MTTADRTAPARAADVPRETVSGRWPPARRLAFEVLAPAALVLVATDGPVSVTLWGRSGEVARLGHNRGIWPAKVARTGVWKDTVTATHDKSPFYRLGTQFRLWCPTEPERDQLAARVVDLIAARAESDGGRAVLRHGFEDLGPDLDLDLFQIEIAGIAERIGVTVWDDDSLVAFLDQMVARAERLAAEGRGHRRVEVAYEAAAMKLLGRG